MIKTDYTREELIGICEKAFVPQICWYNRDSSSAQRQMAEAWILLKDGCEFFIYDEKNDSYLHTNERTIWVNITYHGFDYFEVSNLEEDHFYLPTVARLEEVNGKDLVLIFLLIIVVFMFAPRPIKVFLGSILMAIFVISRVTQNSSPHAITKTSNGRGR